MRKPRTRTRLGFYILFGLVVGGCTVGVRKVVVGPTPDKLSHAEVTISIKAKDVVYWRSSDGTELSIVFHHQDFPPQAQQEPPFIFGGAGQDQTMSCKDGVCFSYDINPRLSDVFARNPSLKELRYKYEQKLGPKGDDGMIIINP